MQSEADILLKATQNNVWTNLYSQLSNRLPALKWRSAECSSKVFPIDKVGSLAHRAQPIRVRRHLLQFREHRASREQLVWPGEVAPKGIDCLVRQACLLRLDVASWAHRHLEVHLAQRGRELVPADARLAVTKNGCGPSRLVAAALVGKVAQHVAREPLGFRRRESVESVSPFRVAPLAVGARRVAAGTNRRIEVKLRLREPAKERRGVLSA
mmetsp:Transcript_55891/g.121703  ORF Transcript_55891/g.121703 Transcript_55891/m.121703 type:complete len:212 (+) Transcript_55891:86-721(+)